jgi:hypothetical protein
MSVNGMGVSLWQARVIEGLDFDAVTKGCRQAGDDRDIGVIAKKQPLHSRILLGPSSNE